MDWDDLRHVLAIARAGSLGGAARVLGLNASSVYRRLQALETTLGVRVFERLRSGYQLTAHGRVLAESAARIETEALAAERRIAGADQRLSGSIRVSTSEPIGLYLLPDCLREFAERYPEVSLTLSITNELSDLTRRDADVVVRGTATPPEHLVGRRVAAIGFAAYAARSYLDRVGRGRALADYHWLGPAGSQLRTPQARWLMTTVPDVQPRLTTDSLAALVAMARTGLGAAAMACFVGDAVPELERITAPQPAEDFGIWLLTHRDLRRTSRLRAFTRVVGDAIRDRGDGIAGLAPTRRR